MTLLATEITNALVALLTQCVARRGFVSDVGARVFASLLKADYSQAPAAFIHPGRTTADVLYGEARRVSRVYTITACANSLSHPTLSDAALADQIVWDVRRCIESPDDTLLELVERVRFLNDQPGYREEGGSIVGATLTYEVSYAVDLNDVETAL